MPKSNSDSLPRDFTGPLFVIGLPRSGTKLLRGLLNEHPQVGIPLAETEFLHWWSKNWKRWGDLTDRDQFQRFYDEVTLSAYFTYLQEEQGHQISADDWFAHVGDGTLPEVLEALLRHDANIPRGGNGVWGDKSPGYVSHLPLIHRYFPHARVVHIVRDVRDYCLSINKAWGKNMVRAAQRWTDRIEMVRREGAVFGGQLIEVRYEDLLSDPEPVLRSICALVGLPFDDRMLTLSQETENIGSARGQKKIKRDNVAKYEREMAPKIRNAIEAIAGHTLDGLGYPVDLKTSGRRIGRPRMLAYQVLDGINLVRADAGQRGWVGAARFRLRLFFETGEVEKGE